MHIESWDRRRGSTLPRLRRWVSRRKSWISQLSSTNNTIVAIVSIPNSQFFETGQSQPLRGIRTAASGILQTAQPPCMVQSSDCENAMSVVNMNTAENHLTTFKESELEPPTVIQAEGRRTVHWISHRLEQHHAQRHRLCLPIGSRRCRVVCNTPVRTHLWSLRCHPDCRAPGSAERLNLLARQLIS